MSDDLYKGRIPFLVGIAALVFLVGGLGYWSATTKISGAIIANGMVQVQSNRQVVQHLDGGTVRAILVQNGDPVRVGQVLIRLDDTELSTELDIVSGQLLELNIRNARLVAESSENLTFDLSDDIIQAARVDPNLKRQIQAERKLLEARVQTAEQERLGLVEQINQVQAQLIGLDAQLTALAARKDLLIEQLARSEHLFNQGLVQSDVVVELKAKRSEIAGNTGRLEAEKGALKGKIEELKIEQARARLNRIEEAMSKSREVEFRLIELQERKSAILDRLSRLAIRAPIDGIVFDLRVFAQDSVVRPADDLLFIFPRNEPLIVSARVEPINIDQVVQGQDVALRFPALDQRTTPELAGHVALVSPDAIVDPGTGASFFPVELLPDKAELHKLGDQKLLPGMPVEVLIKTDERTPLSFLVKPLSDYFAKAFRG